MVTNTGEMSLALVCLLNMEVIWICRLRRGGGGTSVTSISSRGRLLRCTRVVIGAPNLRLSGAASAMMAMSVMSANLSFISSPRNSVLTPRYGLASRYRIC